MCSASRTVSMFPEFPRRDLYSRTPDPQNSSGARAARRLYGRAARPKEADMAEKSSGDYGLILTWAATLAFGALAVWAMAALLA